MNRRERTVVAAILVGAVIATGAGIALARGPDDDESPITGSDLERASEAAVRHLGEGRVTDTEVGDEESYFEVEVTLNDGRQVDVQLDEAFNVVGTESEGSDERDD